MNNKRVKIDVFCCNTSYDPTELAKNLKAPEAEVNYIPLPCSGKLDILYLVKAFETGADGVAVMICKEGECRYLEGNLRAKKRAAAVGELLQETGLSADLLQIIQLDDRGLEQTAKELEKFCGRIAAAGKSAAVKTA
jgi:F420-non-reducing hydrogenase iron-sulfur subunit